MFGLRHELTTGRCVIFAHDEYRGHGNFHPASYRAILEHPEWARRLGKAHTGSKRAMPRADWRWRELDSASSSDALLMNIFCHPGTLRDSRVTALLGVGREVEPRFGVRVGVPLANGRPDTTEVDMELGSLLIEAKLTESNFQTARPALVLRYRDLREVFAVDELPRTQSVAVAERWDEEQAAMVCVERGSKHGFVSYQLIRNALAAHAMGTAFCVLADARRADLVQAWHRVQRAVLRADLRCRLQLLTWQELAAALPGDLQRFLGQKYGIVAAQGGPLHTPA
jgi:hypothetical protein